MLILNLVTRSKKLKGWRIGIRATLGRSESFLAHWIWTRWQLCSRHVYCMVLRDGQGFGVQTSKTFDIKVSSPTYEGWMVLVMEGEEEGVFGWI